MAGSEFVSVPEGVYEWPELADDSVDCVRVLEVVLDRHT